MRGCADAKERLAGGERVAVEDRLGGAAAAGLAADQRMLSAFAMAGEIGIGSVGRRDVRIVLLDPGLHLREQGFLQRNGSGEGGLRIGVFGLQVRSDVRIEQARIAHHRLPIGVLEPGEFVGQGDAVPHRARWAEGGAGRCHGRDGGLG
jgi:hypothetical protein